ncbi:hypothetical protein [Paenibacillus sp. GXUN7292]|uniref:hypothetical protein n=1 Tax=Paenibacillus sp. GXUN7292 TaxID=3422499 RepID=UPI003D7EBDC8
MRQKPADKQRQLSITFHEGASELEQIIDRMAAAEAEQMDHHGQHAIQNKNLYENTSSPQALSRNVQESTGSDGSLC